MLAASLFAAALAIRVPFVTLIPQFTDETLDAPISQGILRGKFPLVGSDAYTGGFHYYLEALALWVSGSSVYAPRLLILILGALTTLPTYLLARESLLAVAPAATTRQLRWAGLTAGGLVATNAIHVATNSHIAWPHCTVPLYLTFTVFAVERALRTSAGRWLVAAGLGAGLAQQQHPTMALIWPVLAVYVLVRRRHLVLSRWGALAVLAVAVGVAPLLVYNARSGLRSVFEAMQQVGDYQEGRNRDFSLAGRAVDVASTSLRLPASVIDAPPGVGAALSRIDVPAYVLVSVAGLVLAARAGAAGPAAAAGSLILLLPFFPAVHEILPRQGRYIMPAIPMLYVGAGVLSGLLMARPRGLQRIALIGAVAILVAYPLLSLAGYYTRVLEAGETNQRYYVTLAAAMRLRLPEEPVVLDPTLLKDRPGGGGTAHRTFDFLFTVSDVPHITLEQSADRIDRRTQAPTVLVVADERPGSISTSANNTVWEAAPLPNDEGGGFTLWRYTRR
ncbi:MAG: glycosyltransferase family 39 protein [Chloroflexota bacterium]